MQKVNVATIIIWHLRTFRDDAGRPIWSDLLTFYGFPIISGIFFFWFDWRISKDALELSVNVFSIFAALLLSVQVAIYSVSLRPLTPPEDQKKRKAFDGITAVRATVIRELNDNIAYLILLSIIFVTIILIFFSMDFHGRLASSFVLIMYIHFFLTAYPVRSGGHNILMEQNEDRSTSKMPRNALTMPKSSTTPFTAASFNRSCHDSG